MHTQTTKKPVFDYAEGTAWTEKIYTSDMSGLHVINDTAAVSVKVTAAGFTMTLGAAGKELNEDFPPFSSVVIEPADGTKQVETATAAGTITLAGNASVVVTMAGMANSPKTIAVPVALSDTAAIWAGKVRAALTADVDVAAKLTITGATTAIIATCRAAAANDATLNIRLDNGTCTGITTAATSANTTAGIAPSAISFRAWVRG
jgi:hypothetical protein